MQFNIQVTNKSHEKHAHFICELMEKAAKVRGTGIAKRKPEYIKEKMSQGRAVIALDKDIAVGFCYIESWEGKKYVSNSGLIIHPDYRKKGLAKAIKKEIFELSKNKFPDAKLFGITTSMAVMKINSNLGYKPVAFSELTTDEDFWKGCQNCTNYDVLQRTNKTMCLCTGMVCDFKETKTQSGENKKSWDKFIQFLKDRKKRIQEKAKLFPKLLKSIKYGK